MQVEHARITPLLNWFLENALPGLLAEHPAHISVLPPPPACWSVVLLGPLGRLAQLLLLLLLVLLPTSVHHRRVLERVFVVLVSTAQQQLRREI